MTKVGWSKWEKEKRLGNRVYSSGSEMLRRCDIHRSWENRDLYFACFGPNLRIGTAALVAVKICGADPWGADHP